MTAADMRMAIMERLAVCETLALAAGWTAQAFETRFDLRGTCSGRAARDGSFMRLNLHIALANPDEFLGRTPGHEYAHLMVAWRYAWHPGQRARRPHGVEWQAAMRALGQDPSRCHDMTIPDSARTMRMVDWACPCRTHKVTARKHANMSRPGWVYRCGRCRGVLVLVAK